MSTVAARSPLRRGRSKHRATNVSAPQNVRFETNPRQELIALLRGRFAVPVISALAERELLPRMRQAPFRISDFHEVRDQAVLLSIFRYLQGLGLLAIQGGEDESCFIVTDIGQTVFNRAGAFLILDSYHDYFAALPQLLAGEETKATVERSKNVLGCGMLHRRKFFPAALEIVRQEAWDAMVDIGCGDGTYLSEAMDQAHAPLAVGVDLSPEAVGATRRRLCAFELRTVVADAFDVSEWARMIPRSSRCVISLWFVVHEFSQRDENRVVEFFRRISDSLPNAEIVVGELVDHSPEVLAPLHTRVILPEFQLFHELSGQGVLSWEQHQTVLSRIPYELAGEVRFDEIRGADGKLVPSSFVWHLKPH